MGLAGLDQVEQAGGVQRELAGQALGGHGEAGGVLDALAAVDIFPGQQGLSLIHISEPTRLGRISYAVFCLKKQ